MPKTSIPKKATESVKAVRLMNEDTSMDFEAALHSSTTVTTAKKFFNNIKKADINKIVKAAKEVIKYDA